MRTRDPHEIPLDPSPDGVEVALPSPQRADRWQPIRCGLLNIYRYDEEEFRFEQGRLLLRGDNGTGKSRVLALQLPFLLDGEVSPSRVEPDGDTAKRIEWHLLMGRWPDRTGYTWIEFGRMAPEGRAEFVTLGCGMRAVAGRSGLHSRWFFMTRQRVGRDLFLQSADRRPHGRDRLEQALADQGRVFLSAEEYRRAVDDALFGLGPRYERLIDLLIRLRRPKLSQKLDEEELSNTLSEALPVLPAGLIEEVAEAFRSLESDRDALRGFVETREAVQEFLREYSVYARIAVRRRAAAVRSAHSQYEEAQRSVRESERRVAEADARLAELAESRAVAERDHAAAEEAVRTLRSSPEMQTASELAHAEKAARAADAARGTAHSEAQSARRTAEQAREQAESAERHHADIAAEVETRLRSAMAKASAAAMQGAHELHFGTRDAGTIVDPAGLARRAEPALARAMEKLREAIDHLRGREREVDSARREWEISDAARRRAADACTVAREAERGARAGLDQAAAAFQSAFETWRTDLSVLPIGAADTNADEFAAWVEHREGANPWRLAADSVYRRILTAFTDEIADRRQDLAEETKTIDALRAEWTALESGNITAPAPIPGRLADRRGRPGAPLWRICDFRPETTDAERAGVEAALEASGLLDAWLLPDGRLVHPATEDAFLHAEPSQESVSGESLGRWLVPALDSGDPMQQELTPDRIEQLLAGIGGEPNRRLHWVAPDGSWRLGPLSGRWSKSTAAFIGEGARAEARRRRMAELEEELGVLEAAREELAAGLRQLEDDRTTADAEWAAFPGDRPILEAGVRLGVATVAMGAAFAAHEDAERSASRKRIVLEEAEARRDRDAGDLNLGEWVGRLEDLRQALAEYSASLSALWPTLRHWQSNADRLGIAREHHHAAEAELEVRTASHQKAAEQSAAAAMRHETLLAMHGATVAVVLESLRQAEERIIHLRRRMEENQQEQIRQAAAKATSEASRDHARSEQSRNDGNRRAAIQSLEAMAFQQVLAEAHEPFAAIETGPWAVNRAVEIARQIEPLFAETTADDDTWRRRQDSIHDHVQDLRDRLMAHNHQPETHQIEDLVLVRCRFQTRAHSMTELRDAFTAEIHERQRLLEAREREIIENHLLGEAAVELQRLVRGAEEWIASANRELATRPTSTGLRFRFVWEAALEGAFAEVRKAFLKTSELWSPGERTQITRFLQERIRAEQSANEQGSWRDQLGAALDYRRWHRFLVERQQDGLWRRLDKRTYGTGSGGEKALALTLPRFAAAAAHYRSARPDSPRLVLLDEAFAGIDPTMRAQCMGMLAQFDLDVVMTSELEWGCYPSVPGLAIYHLTARPGVDAVASTLWIWNGRQRTRGTDAFPDRSPPLSDTAGANQGLPLLDGSDGR